jgi:hypothetical protein
MRGLARVSAGWLSFAGLLLILHRIPEPPQSFGWISTGSGGGSVSHESRPPECRSSTDEASRKGLIMAQAVLGLAERRVRPGSSVAQVSEPVPNNTHASHPSGLARLAK